MINKYRIIIFFLIINTSFAKKISLSSAGVFLQNVDFKKAISDHQTKILLGSTVLFLGLLIYQTVRMNKYKIDESGKVVEYEKQVKQLKNDITNASLAIEENKKKVVEYEEQIKQLKKTITHCRSSIVQNNVKEKIYIEAIKIESDKNLQDERMCKLTEKMNLMKKDAQDEKSYFEQRLQKEKNDCQWPLEQKDKKIQSLVEEVEDLKQREAKAKIALVPLEQQIDQLQAEIQSLMQEVNDLRHKQEEIVKLKKEIKALKYKDLLRQSISTSSKLSSSYNYDSLNQKIPNSDQESGNEETTDIRKQQNV
mgnify:CR=1 FL=1